MPKFKIGQVVALQRTGNKDYRYISGIAKDVDVSGRAPKSIYFVDGDLATRRKDHGYQNGFFFEDELRPLNKRELGK